jgi:two-component system nitrogen regulation response regulator NtrX
LRQRPDDIPLLVETFLKEFARQAHGKPKQMASDALNLLAKAPWPGNVRELKNLMERLSIMVKGSTIQASHLPVSYNPDICPPCNEMRPSALSMDNLESAKAAFEAAFIQNQLAIHDQDVEKAAGTMGISVETLTKKLGSRPPGSQPGEKSG